MSVLSTNRSPYAFHLKDPASAISHLIGLIFAILMTPPLLIYNTDTPISHQIALSIFMLSMSSLYAASTLYHSLTLSKNGQLWLKRLDHMMISVLIAGSYTPCCLIFVGGQAGLRLLIVVWSIAVCGMLFKLFWVTCPKVISSILYIALGWSCLSVMPTLLHNLPLAGFALLFAGGLFYTIGGVIYALKLSVLNTRFPNFGSHEIFHLFVLAGSICHYALMFHFSC